ncbi:interleukin-1 beta [Echeneis naucrates]|uniref:Interleukin-1 n=1 Tax=Echeneis naucrates TaxID=173247 RepID=A0A665V0S7_ECHNA|nr:interleukin-1 receptor antagonist protein [Echeneis naucrates]
MYHFDLRQALDGPLDLDEAEPESSSFDMTALEGDIINLEEGLDMVVSKNPKTLKGVTILVMTMNKIQNPPKCSSWKLSDEQLYGEILDRLVDKKVIKTVANVSKEGKTSVFNRLGSLECTLTDNSHKDIICKSEGLELQAITLKGGARDSKVNFKMVHYASPDISKGFTCVLSVKKSNWYFSCVENGDQPKLKLEECSEARFGNFSVAEKMDRFLFIHTTTGMNISRFESVRCSGWFISTSSVAEDKPVEMCEVDAAQRITSFKVNYSRE